MHDGSDWRHIACAADTAYVPHAAAMLHSVLSTQEHASLYCVHFLHGPQFADLDRARLKALVERFGSAIKFHLIPDEWVAELPDMGRISRVMWYRIFLPELVPEAQRLLYLDCDVIAMDGLDALWTLDLSNHYVAAVSNVFEQGYGPRIQSLGLKDASNYFNSGVLLLNMSLWRAETCTRKILSFVEERAGELIWPDQDALNSLFAGRWLALHPRWNCQNSFFYFRHANESFPEKTLQEAVRTPGLLHFEGGDLAKPWHYLCKNPFREQYFRHLERAGWPRPAIEGANLGNKLLRLLPKTWILPALRLGERLRRVIRRLTQRQ